MEKQLKLGDRNLIISKVEKALSTPTKEDNKLFFRIPYWAESGREEDWGFKTKRSVEDLTFDLGKINKEMWSRHKDFIETLSIQIRNGYIGPIGLKIALGDFLHYEQKENYLFFNKDRIPENIILGISLYEETLSNDKCKFGSIKKSNIVYKIQDDFDLDRIDKLNTWQNDLLKLKKPYKTLQELIKE